MAKDLVRLKNGTVKANWRIKHGLYGTPTYASWQAMLERCYRKQHVAYTLYGERGITVYPPWKKSFSAFLNDVGIRPTGTTLDRFPNKTGNYEPGNVRWATRLEQGRNKSNNVILDHNGRSAAISEWAEILGVKESTLRERRKRGWTVVEILSIPVQKHRPKT